MAIHAGFKPTDCKTTTIITKPALGTAADPNWYNSNTTAGENNTCFNCPGAQWTGTNAAFATLTEYTYDLTPFNAETNIMFRTHH